MKFEEKNIQLNKNFEKNRFISTI